jgi:hypothetical protein
MNAWKRRSKDDVAKCDLVNSLRPFMHIVSALCSLAQIYDPFDIVHNGARAFSGDGNATRVGLYTFVSAHRMQVSFSRLKLTFNFFTSCCIKNVSESRSLMP